MAPSQHIHQRKIPQQQSMFASERAQRGRKWLREKLGLKGLWDNYRWNIIKEQLYRGIINIHKKLWNIFVTQRKKLFKKVRVIATKNGIFWFCNSLEICLLCWGQLLADSGSCLVWRVFSLSDSLSFFFLDMIFCSKTGQLFFQCHSCL